MVDGSGRFAVYPPIMEINGVAFTLPSTPKIKIIENFGTLGYFSCMKHCQFMLGNSSSGIIEAGSLNKWVINIGNRQSGRIFGNNILHSPISKDSILEKVKYIESKNIDIEVDNPYDLNGASQNIINYLKSYAGF